MVEEGALRDFGISKFSDAQNYPEYGSEQPALSQHIFRRVDWTGQSPKVLLNISYVAILLFFRLG